MDTKLEKIADTLAHFDEARFRAILRLLLCKLKPKVSYVDLTHGPAEHGKDLVFLDTDRFGKDLWWCVVAKAGNLGVAQLRKGSLIQQIQAAFTCGHTAPSVEGRFWIGRCLVAISGTITHEGKSELRDQLRKLDLSQHTIWLEGMDIANLIDEHWSDFGEPVSPEIHKYAKKYADMAIASGVQSAAGIGILLRDAAPVAGIQSYQELWGESLKNIITYDPDGYKLACQMASESSAGSAEAEEFVKGFWLAPDEESAASRTRGVSVHCGKDTSQVVHPIAGQDCHFGCGHLCSGECYTQHLAEAHGNEANDL